ncbi:lytic polysaccharide monooxygenase auxiliary activity family 9 protein [Sodalis sp. RH14]|uniref:lytic polysaccharide monooxygenase auxiliary activity family 9 protein n=1 Tax=Sodalis sp. RH14 TaxID=3394329 RepID=UPI0039B6C125
MSYIDNNQLPYRPDHCQGGDYRQNYGYPPPYPFYEPIDPQSGRVVSPASRAVIMLNNGYLPPFLVDEMTGGKNFPDLFAGPVLFPFHTDIESSNPPPDGRIVSGGNGDARDIANATDEELRVLTGGNFNQWPRLRVNPAQSLTIQWVNTIPRVTRGYRAFITRDNWDSRVRIARNQLEPVPFFNTLNQGVPWQEHLGDLQPRITLPLVLPFNKRGHHVIILLWLVANQPIAIYQAFDVDFG